MKMVHSVVVLCLVVLPLAMARRDLHVSQQPLTVAFTGCPQMTCPTQLSWERTKNKRMCEIQMPKQICCGGDTGVKCPSVSCGFAYASAISSPGGCAWAESMVSTVSYSPTHFSYVEDYAYKCFRYLATSEETQQEAYFGRVEALATACGQAVATSFLDAIQYACNQPSQKCRSCSTCRQPGTKAVSIVKGRGQAVAEMVAVAVASAYAEAFEDQLVYKKDKEGFEDDDYKVQVQTQAAGVAYGLSTAISKATNLALVEYTNRVETGFGVSCTSPTLKSLCAREVAKAVACAVVKATMLYFGDDGKGNSALVASQCSSAVALASSNRDLELPEMIRECAGVNQQQAALADLAAAGNGVVPTQQDEPDKCVCKGNSIPVSVDGWMHCVPYGLQALQGASLPAEFELIPLALPGKGPQEGSCSRLPAPQLPYVVLEDGSQAPAEIEFEPAVNVRNLKPSSTPADFWRQGAPMGLPLFEARPPVPTPAPAPAKLTIHLPRDVTAFSMKCKPAAPGSFNMRFGGVDSTNGMQTSVMQACTRKDNPSATSTEPITIGAYMAGPGTMREVTISSEEWPAQGLVCSDFVISTTQPAWPRQADCNNTGCKASGV